MRENCVWTYSDGLIFILFETACRQSLNILKSLYDFCWVIPRRLSFMCRRFGTLSNLHRFTLPIKMEQSVPKRRHIKFRRRGITQKREYDIQNTAKVWNQENCYLEAIDRTLRRTRFGRGYGPVVIYRLRNEWVRFAAWTWCHRVLHCGHIARRVARCS